ncbi:MAG: hypothetical protein PHC33_04405 [Candidatus Omnitrophica bacterium]|nr:hypothetical protein [Candidatus Omnitrophota bacterium]
MRKKMAYSILFLIGIGAGVIFGLHKARASSPEGETSGGEQPASVYYDEFWQATGAAVSSNGGYVNVDPSGHAETAVAAAWTTADNVSQVNLLPKMVVTQWTVHGHIHFE